MKLHKAYKYKLSPNATQKQQFEQILGSCRYPRFFDKYKKKLIELQQSLARKTKGSHNWKNLKRQLSRLYAKIARARKDWQHKLSTNLVRTFPAIIVEKLNIKEMTKCPKPKLAEDGKTYLPNKAAAKGGLNRSILDTAPAQFFTQLEYKCVWQQRGFEQVNPKNSSRECSECGHISKENRKTQALFLCVSCGHTANADVDASKVILSRGSTTLAAQVRLEATTPLG